MAKSDLNKYLPLSETTYYIMLALTEPMHGYGIMQKVEAMSDQTVRLGPGTLYGVLATLERQGVIVKTGEEDRRKYYILTDTGRAVLEKQFVRLEQMASIGKKILQGA